MAAIKSGFRQYAKFDGRATRPEFWWFALACLLIAAIAIRADLWLTANQVDRVVEMPNDLPGVKIIRRIPYEGVSYRGLLSVATFGGVCIPLAAAMRRRLRDAGCTEAPLSRFVVWNAFAIGTLAILVKFPPLGYASYFLIALALAFAVTVFLLSTVSLSLKLTRPTVPLTIEMPS